MLLLAYGGRRGALRFLNPVVSPMNKMVYRALGAALLSAAAFGAQAQISFGPRVGVNFADVRFGSRTAKLGTKMLPGAQLGAQLNIPLGKLAVQPAVLFSQKGYRLDDRHVSEVTNRYTTFPAGYETREHYRVESHTVADIRLSYVEVPVNLVYTFGQTRGFQLLAGPYVGVGISGKERHGSSRFHSVSTTTVFDQPDGSGRTTLKITDDRLTAGRSVAVRFTPDVKSTDDRSQYSYYQLLDCGLNAGVGYRRDRVQVQAAYGVGARSILPKYSGEASSWRIRNRVLQLSVSYLFATSRR